MNIVGFQRYVHDPDAYSHEKPSAPWKPLTDDGDALRLAVELKIGFKYHLNAPPEMGLPRECAVSVTDFGKWFAEVDRDKEKATRRAIVRAAAAIGEAMQ